MKPNLDKEKTYQAYDPANMAGFISDYPNQIKKTWDECQKIKLPPDYKDLDNIIMLGMGGSGIGAEIISSYLSPKIKIPIFVIKNYDLPAFASEKSLIIATSFSGKTEETINATRQALSRKSKILIISKNGEMMEIAKSNNLPYYQFEYPSPPRAALGITLIAPLAIIAKLDYIKIDSKLIEEIVALAIKTNEIFSPHSQEENLAKFLAQKIEFKIPYIFGSGLFEKIAVRFANQLNENSKIIAIAAGIPESNHNVIEGLTNTPEIFSNFHFVILASAYDHERNKKRLEIFEDVLGEKNISYNIIHLQGKSVFSQAIYGIMLGDWTSYYLAMLYKTNPLPNATIDTLKEKMKK